MTEGTSEIVSQEEPRGDKAPDLASVAEVIDGAAIGPTLTRRQFLKLAGAAVGSLMIPSTGGEDESGRITREELSEGNKEPRFPLESLVFLPPLMAWAEKAETPQERERRGKIAIALFVGFSAAIGGGAWVATQLERMTKERKEKKEFAKLPKEVQKEIKRRQKAEEDESYQQYAKGFYSGITPNRIDSKRLRWLFANAGRTWMFHPNRKADLEEWFGKEFSEEEINYFRFNPNATKEFYNLLKSAGASREVIEFYQQDPAVLKQKLLEGTSGK